jgi:hypothetical protein
MNASTDAYERLMAARREVTPYEREEAQKESDRERLAAKIRRRLPKVY